LHLAKDFLRPLPVVYGLLQRLVLLPGQRDGDGLGLDLAGPLVTGAAGSRSAILDIAVANPAQAPQAGAQSRIFSVYPNQIRLHEYQG